MSISAIYLAVSSNTNPSCQRTVIRWMDGAIGVALIIIAALGFSYAQLAIPRVAGYVMGVAGSLQLSALILVTFLAARAAMRKRPSPPALEISPPQIDRAKAAPLAPQPPTLAEQRLKPTYVNLNGSPTPIPKNRFMNDYAIIRTNNEFDDDMMNERFLPANLHNERLLTRAGDFLDGKAFAPPIADQALGVMFAMACGEALGIHFDSYPFKCDSYLRPGQPLSIDDQGQITGTTLPSRSGSFGVGQWSSATATALCLADILIEERRVDGIQLMWAFRDLLEQGYNDDTSSTFHEKHYSRLNGKNAIALREFLSHSPHRSMKDSNEHTLVTPIPDQPPVDCGSLSRNGPVAIFASSEKSAVGMAFAQNRVTHRSEESDACTELMTRFLYRALHSTTADPRQKKRELFASFTSSLSGLQEKIMHDAQRDQALKPQMNGHRHLGAQARHALMIALHSIYITENFEQAVTQAICHGGSASYLGAITAELAGALYGAGDIPLSWRNCVRKWDSIDSIALRALYLHKINLESSSI